MIIASQGYVFAQQYGQALTPELLARIVYDAGFAHHDHMIPLADLVRRPEALDDYLAAWSSAFGSRGITVLTAYAGLPNHERFAARHEPALRHTIGRLASSFPGLRTVTTNPDPLPNGERKTDEMLEAETRDLVVLAGILKEHDIALSLHFHTPELHDDARELHAILGTIPANTLSLTFDVNWCLRGGQPIDEILDRYEDRVDILHLRSSRAGVWEERLGPGDEDNPGVLRRLRADSTTPICVVELANEPAMKETMNLVERLRASRVALEEW